MKTVNFEVQVLQDGRWTIAQQFGAEEREEALSFARRLFNVDRVPGVRVFTEKFDENRQIFTPQYLMREVRPGVKVDRDAPVDRSTPAPRRAAERRGGSEVLIGGRGWSPPTADELATLRPVEPAGQLDRRRFGEIFLMILGLFLEGVGFAILLAALEASTDGRDTRPALIGLAIGILVAGLVLVVRQVGRLRDLGGLLLAADAEAKGMGGPAPQRRELPPILAPAWRDIIGAVFFNRFPSKYGGEPPPAEPAAVAAVDAAVAPLAPEEPMPTPPPTPPAPTTAVAHLTGFIERVVTPNALDGAADQLASDPQARFAAYLYLRGAADACVAAAGAATGETPQPVLAAALDPLKLSVNILDDFAVRFQVLRQSARHGDVVARGRAAVAAVFGGTASDTGAPASGLSEALAEWGGRESATSDDAIVLLTVEARLAGGGAPPDAVAVTEAFAQHRRAVAAAAELYRGESLGRPDLPLLFRSPADAVAAALEVQARRLDADLSGAPPLILKTAALRVAVSHFERDGGGTQALADARVAATNAAHGEVLVSEGFRAALTGLGYRMGAARAVRGGTRDVDQMAAVDWDGAPSRILSPLAAERGD